jgi:hypothetical protein
VHALAELKEAQKRLAELAIIAPKVRLEYIRLKQIVIPGLEREYRKLARRAAHIKNANMRSGPLDPTELVRLHEVGRFIKTMSTSNRTLKRTPLSYNLRNKIARLASIP